MEHMDDSWILNEVRMDSEWDFMDFMIESLRDPAVSFCAV